MSMFSLALVSTAVGQVIYVDADANGANDGTSWADAYKHLQQGLWAAYYGYGDGIRVAKGVYKPTEPGGYREVAFDLVGGVSIKGGYAGFGEPNPNARDIKAYETILSGDLNGDDIEVVEPKDLLDEPTRADNSHNVITIGYYITDYDAPPLLDGLTITGGNARGSYTNGGGIRIYGYSKDAIITDCTFINNSSKYSGGAIAFMNSRVIFTRCSFIRNAAEESGGAASLTGCGTCRDSYAAFHDCRFINNYAGGNGGALHNSCPTLTTLINCIIAGNTAGGSGGGLYHSSHLAPSLVNCTFTGNRARNGGGGLYAYLDYHYTNPILTNCILWGDTPDEISSDSTNFLANVTYSNIEGGWPGTGNIDADPCFVLPGYQDANGMWIDGDYYLLPGSPCINAGDPNYIAEPSAGTIPTVYHFNPDDPGYIAVSSVKDLDGEPRVISGRVDMGASEHRPIVPAEVRIVPPNINLTGKGKWITCYIRLPEDCNVADIEPGSIRLEDEIRPRWMWFDEQKQIAMVKFKRSEVRSALEGLELGDVELTVSGELSDGTLFKGTDIIGMRGAGKSVK